MQIIHWLLSFIVDRAYAFEPKDFSVIQDPGGAKTGKADILGNITTKEGYTETLDSIILYMLIIAGGLAFIALLVGAWQYLLAAGDQQKAAVAKKTITYSIIGIVLIMLLIAILN